MNNEELEDLMYRAGLTAQGCWDSMDQYDREAIMNFAESIIKECMGVVQNAVDRREPASTYVDKIKQHFGLEQEQPK